MEKFTELIFVNKQEICHEKIFSFWFLIAWNVWFFFNNLSNINASSVH